MKKILLLFLVAVCSAAVVSAQTGKPHPPKRTTPRTSAPELSWPGRVSVPPAERLFPVAPTPLLRHKPGAFVPPVAQQASVEIMRDADGTPIFFSGLTVASGSSAETKPTSERALAYTASLSMPDIATPAAEFAVQNVEIDALGEAHVRMQQMWNGIPVYGGEVIAHTRKGAFDRLNGRYYPTPDLDGVAPAISAAQAIDKVKAAFGAKLKTTWTEQEKKMIGGEPYTTTLVVYHPNEQRNAERLAWHIEAHPNLLRRAVYFIDAKTGAVMHQFDHTCEIHGGRHRHQSTNHQQTNHQSTNHQSPVNQSTSQPITNSTVNSPVTGTGIDLLGQNRSFGAWLNQGTYHMIDAGRPMFKPTQSKMPDDPVGGLVTLDALNTSPQTDKFDYSIAVSNALSFSSRTAVSAHWNMLRSYEYFRTTFSRNSINGQGGNILSFVNVVEDDGTSMENAFWNGAAMWYGNGGQAFQQLARGLDVGGHEMSHGVIEKTANLEYQNESGAMNESFADIFGAMIDRDDWKIGEDVVRAGISPGGCLRDMANPNNNASRNSPWWQPKNVSERYTGTEDNGGVHINSGIPNHAFYLFANNSAVGRERAEQVFYKALKDYLVKSSRFIDLRVGVLQSATELYGASVANAAAAAFDQVGITGSGGGGQTGGNNPLAQLSVNPGSDLILCMSADSTQLKIAAGDGRIIGTLYDRGVLSRPSVTDNGTEIVFVNKAKQIVLIELAYANGQIQPKTTILSTAADWRNVAVSKDGRYVAALFRETEPIIYLFDFGSSTVRTAEFELYNPTYTQGQATGDVAYADVLEFDYSGEFLMYDAFNELTNSRGRDISYWDIGFLQYAKNGTFTDPKNAFITKAFGGLPENTSIGNPTFAKNSPFIIAFDYIDESTTPTTYNVLGANVETGDNEIIVNNNRDLGFPYFSRLDNAIIYNRPGTPAYSIFRQGVDNTKIKGQGTAQSLVANHLAGVWFANGTRSLKVSAHEADRAALQLTVAPNPAVDRTQVRFEATEAVPARIAVFNALGVLVLEQNLLTQQGVNQVDLDLQRLPAGAYAMQLQVGNRMATVQVMKGL